MPTEIADTTFIDNLVDRLRRSISGRGLSILGVACFDYLTGPDTQHLHAFEKAYTEVDASLLQGLDHEIYTSFETIKQYMGGAK